MMPLHIQYLSNQQIDKRKWDDCIDTASNGLVYAYSYYLDAMADNWDGLVLNDYEAVMPLPWRKKWGIAYLYQPAFTAQLGVFAKKIDETLLKAFLQHVPKKFRYWDFSLNYGNNYNIADYPFFQRSNFVLNLNASYHDLNDQYRENIKRNLKKAATYKCSCKKNIEVGQIIGLAEQQSHSLTERDYQRFANLYALLEHKNVATTYGIYSNDNLVSSAAFFFSHSRAYYILVGNHPNGRTIGASHQLIDSFIKEHANQKLILDFEGSDIRNLAFFYSSFGGLEEKFTAIRLNRLPGFLKWLKR